MRINGSSFAQVLAEWPVARVQDLIAARTLADVDAALKGKRQNVTELLAALLSPAAFERLEPMAQGRRHTDTATIRQYPAILRAIVCFQLLL